MLFSYVNRRDKCIFRRSWAPLWPRNHHKNGVFFYPWSHDVSKDCHLSWCQRYQRHNGHGHVEAHPWWPAKPKPSPWGSSFERGEDLGWFHTTVIFHKKIYNSEFKGALDNLGVDFRKRNADLLVFISTGSTHSLSLSLWKRMLLSHLWRPPCSKGTTGNWKSLSYYILAQQGIPCFELPMMSVPCISHLTASDMKPQLMAEIRREQAGGTTQFLFKKTWQNDILDFFVDVQRKKTNHL